MNFETTTFFLAEASHQIHFITDNFAILDVFKRRIHSARRHLKRRHSRFCLREFHDLFLFIFTKPNVVNRIQHSRQMHFIDKLIHFVTKRFSLFILRENNHNIHRLEIGMNISKVWIFECGIADHRFVIDKAIQLAVRHHVSHVRSRLVILDFGLGEHSARFFIDKDKTRLHSKYKILVFVHVRNGIVLEVQFSKSWRNILQCRITPFFVANRILRVVQLGRTFNFTYFFIAARQQNRQSNESSQIFENLFHSTPYLTWK